ncbi:MAG: hypothetical protein VR70_13350 [Rhodospirillaceae bacterium BRH_c57]|nr:MAG: hypothetical protein VR70_13350 [Rhodospirillaceae bacterium BRH_c57]
MTGMAEQTVGRDWRPMVQTISPLQWVVAGVFLPVSMALIAWGLFALVDWLPILRIPMIVLVAIIILLTIQITNNQVQIQIKRADTATQTLRAASQGKIELVGTVRPIDKPLFSPVYGVSCVSYRSSIAFRPANPAPDGEPIFYSDSHWPAAVLLTDGRHDMFMPFSDVGKSSMEVMLQQADAPLEWLRADLRERLAGNDWTVTLRDEHVIPSDKPLKVNAVLRTLTSRDSYLETRARHLDLLPPQPEDLETDEIELAWRAHCNRREEAAGTGEAVPVDALLPLSVVKVLPYACVADADWRQTTLHLVFNAVVGAASAYLIARLLGATGPWAVLF